MKPFICEHTCEYCVVEGCEERRDLPIGTRTSIYPIQDADNVNVIVRGNEIPIIGVNKIIIGNQIIDRTV